MVVCETQEVQVELLLRGVGMLLHQLQEETQHVSFDAMLKALLLQGGSKNVMNSALNVENIGLLLPLT